jgi:hypothetical protein
MIADSILYKLFVLKELALVFEEGLQAQREARSGLISTRVGCSAPYYMTNVYKMQNTQLRPTSAEIARWFFTVVVIRMCQILLTIQNTLPKQSNQQPTITLLFTMKFSTTILSTAALAMGVHGKHSAGAEI